MELEEFLRTFLKMEWDADHEGKDKIFYIFLYGAIDDMKDRKLKFKTEEIAKVCDRLKIKARLEEITEIFTSNKLIA